MIFIVSFRVYYNDLRTFLDSCFRIKLRKIGKTYEEDLEEMKVTPQIGVFQKISRAVTRLGGD